MAKYTKNPTWADGSGGGTPITAAKLNNVESGIFDAHYQAAARVYHNASQNVNTSTPTAVAFNSERFDTESNSSSTIHDTASNNSRLTCRTAGKYLISVTLDWGTNATGQRYVYFQLNGTTNIAQVTQPGNATVQSMSLTTIYDLAVNDYVEVIVLQDSGGTRTINSNGNYSPEFMMVCVA